MVEFLNIVNAIASHVNVDNIELVVEMVDKLIVLGEQMESAAAAAIAKIDAPAQNKASV